MLVVGRRICEQMWTKFPADQKQHCLQGRDATIISHGNHLATNKVLTLFDPPPPVAKCITSKTKDGRDYAGKLSYTEKGITCQAWNSRWPHRNAVYSGNYYLDYMNSLMERNSRGQYMYHNYCRNPRGRRKRPWCYTTLIRPSWQYCDLKVCWIVRGFWRSEAKRTTERAMVTYLIQYGLQPRVPTWLVNFLFP